MMLCCDDISLWRLRWWWAGSFCLRDVKYVYYIVRLISSALHHDRIFAVVAHTSVHVRLYSLGMLSNQLISSQLPSTDSRATLSGTACLKLKSRACQSQTHVLTTWPFYYIPTRSVFGHDIFTTQHPTATIQQEHVHHRYLIHLPSQDHILVPIAT